MLTPSAPMSNAERQRRFRARHPGYNRKYNGHPTPEQRRKTQQYVAELFARCAAEEKVKKAIKAAIFKPQPLMLPAPAEPITIPGMNTIPAAAEIAADTLRVAA